MPSILGITGAQQSAVVAGNIQAALPTTVLTVFSKEILMKALPNFRLMQFARIKQDLQVEKGDTIRMHRYSPLRKGKKLLEGVAVAAKTMEATTQDIKVEEFGNAVDLTRRLQETSTFDQLMIASEQLGDDYAFTTEVDLMLTLNSLPSVLYANEKANRAALVSTDVMSARTIRAAVEILKTKNVPSFNLVDELTGAVENVFVCFLNPHQARGMREDQAWRDAVQYGNSRRIFMGEIGMYEKVIFIETTMIPVVKAATYTMPGAYFVNSENLSDPAIVDDPIPVAVSPHPTLDVHRAFIVGDYTYGYAEALPVEMIADPPADLRRRRKVGWYSIQGSGLVNADHGLILETV
jgi:N4-gp56 family major capsid protein